MCSDWCDSEDCEFTGLSWDEMYQRLHALRNELFRVRDSRLEIIKRFEALERAQLELLKELRPGEYT